MIQGNYLTIGISVPWVGGFVQKLKMTLEEYVHKREQVSGDEFPGRINIKDCRYRKPVLK